MPSRHSQRATNHSEDGFLLLGAIVAIALVLLVLAIAAPRVARSLRRDREVEAVHRGQQYVRAIQLYYRKFGHYPGSMDQLEHSNMIRFLRQRYTDPITGQDDFATIAVGKNKTTVKTFFGEPITGLPTGGLGSVSSMASPGIGQAAGAASSSAGGFAASSTTSFGPTTGGFGAGSSTTGSSGAAGATATSATTTASATGTSAAGSGATGATGSASGTGSGTGSQSATTFSGTGQPFMGVSLGAHGDSIVEYNEQTTLESWEFLYDPRLDQLKAKAASLNGGPGSIPGSSLGQSSGFGQPGTTGTSGASGTTATPGAPSAPGTTPSPGPTPPGGSTPPQP